MELVKVGDGYDVEFTPERAGKTSSDSISVYSCLGEHQIDIRLNGRSVLLSSCVAEFSPAIASTSTVPETIVCGEVFEFDGKAIYLAIVNYNYKLIFVIILYF